MPTPPLANLPPALLNVPEAAAVLRWEQRALIRAAKRGQIPGAVILPTGEVRFEAETLFAWVRQNIAKGEGGQA